MSSQPAFDSEPLRLDTPVWVLPYADGAGVGADDQLPNYLLAYLDQSHAEYGRSLAKQKTTLNTLSMPMALLHLWVLRNPGVEGVALVFAMGPLVKRGGKKMREVTKAYIRRAAFLSMFEIKDTVAFVQAWLDDQFESEPTGRS